MPKRKIILKEKNILVKNATPKDAKILEKMSRGTREITMAGGRTLGLKYFQTIIQYGIVLIAEIDKKISGFLLAEVYDKTKLSVLTYLVIRPEYRGFGTGTKLMKDYLNRCKKRKIRLVSLFAPKFNKKTLEFYKRLDFKKDKEYILFFKDL